MRHLDTNDWLMMNGMIYKIYTMEDEKKMRQDFLEQLKLLIDFDAADFYLSSDTQDTGLTDPVSCNCDCVSGEYDGLDYSRGLLYGGRSMVYRETDLVDDENRKKSSYYQKVYKPNNWHYSMQMILAKDKQFLGVITLYRAVGRKILPTTISFWRNFWWTTCPSVWIRSGSAVWRTRRNGPYPRRRSIFC